MISKKKGKPYQKNIQKGVLFDIENEITSNRILITGFIMILNHSYCYDIDVFLRLIHLFFYSMIQFFIRI